MLRHSSKPFRIGVVLAVVVGAVLVGALALKWVPELLASNGLSGKDRAEDVGRVRTALLATLAGLLAAIGAYYTHRTFQLNRATLEHNRETDNRTYALDQARLITERFTRAIDQIGNESLDVRLGGIYALERIARDSADDHPQVVEVLTAYVRVRARRQRDERRVASSASMDSVDAPDDASARGGTTPGGSEESTADGKPSTRSANDSNQRVPALPADVEAAIAVLSRRIASQDRSTSRLNLSDTDLRRLWLPEEANFAGADFGGADLENAFLPRANLQGALFLSANLRGARLDDAKLQGASLSSADLRFADLRDANLEDATLYGANLQEAFLDRANLQRASLSSARLQRATLFDADLREAHSPAARLEEAQLARANLEGAMLIDAHLEGCALHRAHLAGATLERARLEGATLEAADLKGANLIAAHLEGADLYLADLAEADLRGAYYSDDTIWPTDSDFDPQERGARLVKHDGEPDSGSLA